jgi:hypothetical protein
MLAVKLLSVAMDLTTSLFESLTWPEGVTPESGGGSKAYTSPENGHVGIPKASFLPPFSRKEKAEKVPFPHICHLPSCLLVPLSTLSSVPRLLSPCSPCPPTPLVKPGLSWAAPASRLIPYTSHLQDFSNPQCSSTAPSHHLYLLPGQNPRMSQILLYHSLLFFSSQAATLPVLPFFFPLHFYPSFGISLVPMLSLC